MVIQTPNKVVDPINGSDNNNGSPQAPWKTLAKAASSASAGDYVGVLGGTYTTGLDIQVSGAVGNRIIFGQHPNATTDAVLDGKGVKCIGQSHIEIRDFTIKNCTTSPDDIGIYVEGKSSGTAVDIIVAGNRIDKILSSGISFWGVPWGQSPGDYERLNSVRIEYNTLTRCCDGGYDECITLANGVNDFYIENNTVKDGLDGTNGGEGIDVKEGCSGGIIQGNFVHDLARRGIYIDGGSGGSSKHDTEDIEVSRNHIYNCPEGFAIMSEGGADVRNIKFVNNLIHDVPLGVFLFDHPGGGSNYVLDDIKFINNTVWGNSQDGLDLNAQRASNVVVQNNILSSYLDRHNKASEVTNKVGGTPGFVSASDYRLTANSVCVNAGTNGGAPSGDFNNNPRPVGGTVDQGCYERQ